MLHIIFSASFICFQTAQRRVQALEYGYQRLLVLQEIDGLRLLGTDVYARDFCTGTFVRRRLGATPEVEKKLFQIAVFFSKKTTFF